jgi:hypothetical protein
MTGPKPEARKSGDVTAGVNAEERIAAASDGANERGARHGANRNDDALAAGASTAPMVTEFAEIVAERVVELLEQRDRRRKPGLATAAEVAKELGVRTSWVYANQTRLGAIKLGDGPKARLRFDRERVERALCPPPCAQDANSRGMKRRRPRKAVLPPGVELLEGRGLR